MLFCFSVANHAQEKTTKRKKHSISFGYGYQLDTKWWRSEIEKLNFNSPKSTNDVYVKYEHALNKQVGIGLDLGFIKVDKDEFGIFAPRFETFAYTAKASRILASVHYHFLKSTKFDPYINIEGGFYAMKTERLYYSHDPNPLNSLGFPPAPLIRNVIKKSKTSGVDFIAGIGMRYFFSKNFGIFGETGVNKSIFQAGIIAGF
jgi:predicted porin